VKCLQKTLRGGSTTKLIPLSKTPPHNMGNIQYAEQANKVFPDRPGFSSASSYAVDECSPGEPVPGGSSRPGYGYGISDLLVPIKRNADTAPFALKPDSGDIDIGALRDHLWEVGTGDAREKCGTVLHTAAACSRHPGEHKPILIPDSCGRRTCPVCWPTWAERAGKRGADVLNGYLTARYGPAQKALPGMKREYLLPRHVSFHPPRKVIEALVDEVVTEIEHPDQFQRVFARRFRELCTEVITGAGGVAGALVLHEIRLKGDRDVNESDRRCDVNRYREVLDRPDWREHVKYYPHCHTALFGFLEPAGDFHARTGWTYRLHRVVEEPENLIFYLLSHAPAADRVNSITYFGGCSPRRLQRVGEYRCREKVRCNECLEAGIPKEEAFRVVSRLDKLTCENDGDPGERLRRRGRGAPVSWTYETISDRKYVKVRRVGIYRARLPGEKKRARDPEGPGVRMPWEPRRVRVPGQSLSRRVRYIREEDWDDYLARGIIPGSWFEPSGGEADAL